MRVRLEHQVPHPPARVFALLSDPASRPRWQERTRDTEVLTPPPAGVGTRWREHTSGVGPVEGEVIGFERDALWAERGVADGGVGELRVTLRPEGDAATRLEVEVELRLRGRRRLLEPALGPMVHHQLSRDLRRLEVLLGEGTG